MRRERERAAELSGGARVEGPPSLRSIAPRSLRARLFRFSPLNLDVATTHKQRSPTTPLPLHGRSPTHPGSLAGRCATRLWRSISSRRRPSTTRTSPRSSGRQQQPRWRPTSALSPERSSRSGSAAATAAAASSGRSAGRSLLEPSAAAACRRGRPSASQLWRSAHDGDDRRRGLGVYLCGRRRCACTSCQWFGTQAVAEPVGQSLGYDDADGQASAAEPIWSSLWQRRPSPGPAPSASRGCIARDSAHLLTFSPALCRLFNLFWINSPRSADLVMRTRAVRTRADQRDARDGWDDVLLGRLSSQVHQRVGRGQHQGRRGGRLAMPWLPGASRRAVPNAVSQAGLLLTQDPLRSPCRPSARSPLGNTPASASLPSRLLLPASRPHTHAPRPAPVHGRPAPTLARSTATRAPVLPARLSSGSTAALTVRACSFGAAVPLERANLRSQEEGAASLAASGSRAVKLTMCAPSRAMRARACPAPSRRSSLASAEAMSASALVTSSPSSRLSAPAPHTRLTARTTPRRRLGLAATLATRPARRRSPAVFTLVTSYVTRTLPHPVSPAPSRPPMSTPAPAARRRSPASPLARVPSVRAARTKYQRAALYVAKR